MTMYKIVILLLIVLNTSGFTQGNSYKPKYSTALDLSKGEQLLNQCSRGTPENISSFWMITANDIKVLEENFKKIKKVKSSDCCYPRTSIRNLNKFGFQYIGVVIKNRKYIYINAFQIYPKRDFETWHKNWKNEPIIMCDGGDAYWGVLFDLDKLKFTELAINGVG